MENITETGIDDFNFDLDDIDQELLAEAEGIGVDRGLEGDDLGAALLATLAELEGDDSVSGSQPDADIASLSVTLDRESRDTISERLQQENSIKSEGGRPDDLEVTVSAGVDSNSTPQNQGESDVGHSFGDETPDLIDCEDQDDVASLLRDESVVFNQNKSTREVGNGYEIKDFSASDQYVEKAGNDHHPSLGASPTQMENGELDSNPGISSMSKKTQLVNSLSSSTRSINNKPEEKTSTHEASPEVVIDAHPQASHGPNVTPQATKNFTKGLLAGSLLMWARSVNKQAHRATGEVFVGSVSAPTALSPQSDKKKLLASSLLAWARSVNNQDHKVSSTNPPMSGIPSESSNREKLANSILAWARSVNKGNQRAATEEFLDPDPIKYGVPSESSNREKLASSLLAWARSVNKHEGSESSEMLVGSASMATAKSAQTSNREKLASALLEWARSVNKHEGSESSEMLVGSASMATAKSAQTSNREKLASALLAWARSVNKHAGSESSEMLTDANWPHNAFASGGAKREFLAASLVAWARSINTKKEVLKEADPPSGHPPPGQVSAGTTSRQRLSGSLLSWARSVNSQSLSNAPVNEQIKTMQKKYSSRMIFLERLVAWARSINGKGKGGVTDSFARDEDIVYAEQSPNIQSSLVLQSKQEHTMEGVSQSGLVLDTTLSSLGTISEAHATDVADLHTPFASNVTRGRPETTPRDLHHDKKAPGKDDLIQGLHDHASLLGSNGWFGESSEGSDNLDETEERNLEEEDDGGGSVSFEAPPRNSEATDESIRDAGMLQINDALARPSWVDPHDSSVSFEDNGAQPKRIDLSSVASVSSTISASSTILNTPGAGTSVTKQSSASRLKHARVQDKDDSSNSVHSSAPSILSLRSHSVKFGSTNSFAEALATRMGSISNDGPSSRWVSKQRSESFDPSESVFAYMQDEDASPDISPPGSPPEIILHDDDSSFGSSQDEEQSMREALHKTVVVWDMIPKETIQGKDDAKSLSRKPSFVVLPNSNGDSDSVLVDSGNGYLPNIANPPVPIPPSDMSVSTAGRSRRRRGQMRRLSIETGAQGATMRTKKKSRYRFDPSTGFRATNHQGDVSLNAGYGEDDPSETYSIAGGSVIDTKTRRSTDTKSASLTVSVMTEKQRRVLLERESRARGRAKAKKKSNPNMISLDAFLSANNENSNGIQDAPSEDTSAASSERSVSRRNNEDETGAIPDNAAGIFNVAVDAGPEKTVSEANLLRTPTFDDIDGQAFDDCLRDFSQSYVLQQPLQEREGAFDNPAGFIRWEQLEAKWKHCEMTSTIASLHPTRQYLATSQGSEADAIDTTVTSESSAFLPKKAMDLNLPGRFEVKDKLWKNRDGFHPHHSEGSITAITGFMFLLGFSHVSKIVKQDGGDSVDKSSYLMEKAQQLEPDLIYLLEHMVEYASVEQSRDQKMKPFFSTHIKSKESILKKAKAKYDGNILQVLDILRGQIVFPDEGSLICGLIKLKELCEEPQKWGGSEKAKSIKVVRMKNLFARDVSGKLCKSELPTGYRHVLLTISFDDSLMLAEVQCHLLPLYNVLGEAGFALHSKLRHTTWPQSSVEEKSLLNLMNHIVEGEGGSNLFDYSPFKVVHELGQESKKDHSLSTDPSKRHGLKEAMMHMISAGISSLQGKPRDISKMQCILAFLAAVLDSKSIPENQGEIDFQYLEFFRSALCSSLDLFSQATSTSLFGWVSMDESTPLDRISERPLELLHDLGCLYAQGGFWNEAEGVFRSLLSRTEQHLPLYHPRVLTAMLDVAIAGRKKNGMDSVDEILHEVSNRLSHYLAEMERSHLLHQAQSSDAVQPGGDVVQFDFGREALQLMSGFVSTFQSLLQRRISQIVGATNDVILFNYSLAADTMVTLANCLKLSECSVGEDERMTSRDAVFYWRLAFGHYRIAFKGYCSPGREGKPTLALVGAGYGCAKCLRELSHSEKAHEFLSIVLGSLLPEVSPQLESVASAPFTPMASETPSNSSEKTRFLPHILPSAQVQSMESESRKFVAAAYCLWLMAVLTMDTKANEKGRMQALKLLHKASISLQYALKMMHSNSEASRASCIELLCKLEEEAKSIIRPIRAAKR